MATYAELLTAATDDAFRNKIRVAVIVAAETVRTEAEATANHTARMTWARSVFQNPEGSITPMVWAVLAANRAAAVATILSASDATVQTAVDAAVNVFAQG